MARPSPVRRSIPMLSPRRRPGPNVVLHRLTSHLGPGLRRDDKAERTDVLHAVVPAHAGMTAPDGSTFAGQAIDPDAVTPAEAGAQCRATSTDEPLGSRPSPG